MKIFVILFSIFFCVSCGPNVYDCDQEVKALYPKAQITTIETYSAQVYIIDRSYGVYCNTGVIQLAIQKANMGSWQSIYCARLDPNDRWDAKEFKKYKCGPEKE